MNKRSFITSKTEFGKNIERLDKGSDFQFLLSKFKFKTPNTDPMIKFEAQQATVVCCYNSN